MVLCGTVVSDFVSKVDPLRYSPAIHVNQEGYMPNYSKKAMVGYYLGNLGEMTSRPRLASRSWTPPPARRSIRAR